MSTLAGKDLGMMLNNKPLFKNLTIDFLPTEIWGIFGPNGAGKTTLLHTLAGLQQPNNGTVYLDGNNILQLKPRIRAQKIGVLLQDTEFSFPHTAMEFALSGRYPHQQTRLTDSQIDIDLTLQCLQQVSMDHFAKRLVTTLSGGEKRRLAIATVLTQNPNIYLLDEPTNHLDLQQKIHILSLFKEQAKTKNKTVIMILHDIHLIRTFCDKVIVFNDKGDNISGNCHDIFTHTNLSKLFANDFLTACTSYLNN